MLYCSPDPILGVSEAFRASTAPQKLNLGVGACESPMPLNILRSAPAHSTYAYVSSIVLVLCVQAGTSQFGGLPLWLGASSVSLHMQYLSVMSAHAPSQGSGVPAPAADPQRMPTRDSLIPCNTLYAATRSILPDATHASSMFIQAKLKLKHKLFPHALHHRPFLPVC